MHRTIGRVATSSFSASRFKMDRWAWFTSRSYLYALSAPSSLAPPSYGWCQLPYLRARAALTEHVPIAQLIHDLACT